MEEEEGVDQDIQYQHPEGQYEGEEDAEEEAEQAQQEYGCEDMQQPLGLAEHDEEERSIEDPAAQQVSTIYSLL